MGPVKFEASTEHPSEKAHGVIDPVVFGAQRRGLLRNIDLRSKAMRKVVVKAGWVSVREQKKKRYSFLWDGRVDKLRKYPSQKERESLGAMIFCRRITVFRTRSSSYLIVDKETKDWGSCCLPS